MKRNFERTESLFDGFTAATVQTTEQNSFRTTVGDTLGTGFNISQRSGDHPVTMLERREHHRPDSRACSGSFLSHTGIE